MNNQQQSWEGKKDSPKKWEEQKKVFAGEWNQVDPKQLALGMGKESIASPQIHQSSYKQPPRNFYLTAAWHGPSLYIHPPKSTPLSTPRKPPDRKQGSLEAPSRLSVPLQPPTFPWLALCHHGLLLVTKTEHKPHSTRARPGLPFARHKHLMSISGVSNPSCSVGGVRSFLSTLTPSLPGRGLGGNEFILCLFFSLGS